MYNSVVIEVRETRTVGRLEPATGPRLRSPGRELSGLFRRVSRIPLPNRSPSAWSLNTNTLLFVFRERVIRSVETNR